MRIKAKINLSFISVFVVVVVIFGFILGYLSIKQMRAQNFREVQNINLLKAEHIKTFLSSEKEVVLMLGASTVFRDFLKLSESSKSYGSEKERASQRLIRSLDSVKQVYELFIVDSSGKIVISTDKTKEGLQRSDDPYFTEGQKGVYIKSLYYSDVVNKLTYAVSAPMRDDNTGELLGVIVARLDPDTLFNITNSTIALGQTGESFLVDKDKYLLTPSRYLSADLILKYKVETQNVADCFGDTGSGTSDVVLKYVDYRGKKIIGTHAFIPEVNWCLITKIDEQEAFSPSYFLLLIFILAFIIALILFVIIGLIISRNIVKPIKELEKGAKIIEGGDLNYRVGIRSKDEIGSLSVSFDKMVEAVKKSRTDIDKKVNEQTKEIIEKQKDLENQQKATLNLLEDVETEKGKIAVSEARNRALLESIGEGVVATDKEGKIIFMNKTAVHMLGLSNEKILGKRLISAWKVSDEKGEKISENNRPIAVALKGKTYTDNSSFYYVRKDGTRFPVSITVTPVIVEDKIIGAIDIFRDITKEREIEKSRVDFLSLASHQLRTPLSGAKWLIETLQGKVLGTLTKKQKDYLSQVYQLNERMIQLVSEMLGILRLESESGEIKTEPISISILNKGILVSMEPGAKSRNVTLTSHLEEGYAGEIESNKEVLKNILECFVSNAINYSKPGQEVVLDVKENPSSLVFSVKDKGIGIPKNEQKNLFEKFYRASNAKAFKPGGSGLGLNIAKVLAEKIGAKVSFESEEGKGSVFYLDIPKKLRKGLAIKKQKI